VGGTILVVDDELGNVEVLADLLGSEYEIVFATSGERALELAAQVKPDLVLLDVMMPGMDGYEVCRRLKQDVSSAAIPVIFITGLTDAEAETRGLELGALDYVTKPFTGPIVRQRVRNHIELKRARDEVTRLALTDGLTGIPNRRRFDEVLEMEYKRLRRRESLLSLILLDIDFFKGFNDTYGHVAGDVCLREIAGVLLAVINRPADLAARYGGEEFACILPETNVHGGATIAAEIQNGIAGLRIPHAGSRIAAHVTASFGVVTVNCMPAMTAVDVVSAADACLYQAKAEGRNRIAAQGDLQITR
jgi:diguanylate cyclase (GGDEF)-like protein